MTVQVDFALSWLVSERLTGAHAAILLRLIAGVHASGSLKQAARAAGVSYRHAWGLLGAAAEAFGAPVVQLERGRGAHPTALGEKLLWADGLIRAALDPELARLRQRIDAELSRTLPRRLPRLVLHASHDLALQALVELCAGRVEIELVFRGADDSLAALANGRCDLAGFHVADALPRAAAAAAALGRSLDPRKHQLIRFVTREQGLIARPDRHIRSVHDLTRPGVRFINRQSGPTGPGAAKDDHSVAGAVAEGRADAGFGLRADALRFKLDFVPLARERYFLVCPRARLREPGLQRLLEVLQGAEFSQRIGALPGYDAAQAGRQEKLDDALNWVERARRPASSTARRDRPSARRAGQAART
jgi:molybdate transport repressor ModE-like protein